MRKIIQRLEVNETIKDYFLLTRIERKQGKSGTYLEMYLTDASGGIKGRKWDVSDKDLQLYEVAKSELPTIVHVKGLVRQFQQVMDLKVFSFALADNTSPVVLSDFIAHSPLKLEDGFKQMEETIFQIKNKVIHDITKEIYFLYKPFLAPYPASSYHHSVYGGLIWHTVNTIQLAKSLIKLYPDLFFEDLLISGAILHDLAKLKDYRVEHGNIKEITDHGKLVGHVVAMANEVRETARMLSIDVTNKDVILLEHLVLSHHPKGSGSPITASTPEAIALQLLTELDSKIGAVNQLMEQTDRGEWSDWSALLETKVKKN